MADSKNTYLLSGEGQFGEIRISDEVLAVIAGIAATEVEGVDSMAGGITGEIIGRLGMNSLSKGVKLELEEDHCSVDLSLNIKYSYNIPEISRTVQEKVKNAIETMTGITVLDVNVRIAGVNIS